MKNQIIKISQKIKSLNSLEWNKIKLIIFITGGLFLFYNFAFFVGQNAVDIPYQDQWGIFDVLRNETSTLKLLTYQHNEHRIGVGLIMTKILADFSNWSQIWEIKFISFLIFISFLFTSLLKWGINKKIELFDLVIPLIFFNIFQFENLDWGFQISFVLPLFFLTLWLLSIRVNDIRKRNPILITISLLASYSSLHGLIIPILTIGFLVLDYIKLKRKEFKSLSISVLLNIFIIVSYFIGFKRNFQAGITLDLTLQKIKYFLSAISTGFFFPYVNHIISDLLGAVVFLFLLIGFVKLIRDKFSVNFNLVGLVFLLYVICFIGIITVGRSSFGIEQALTSRYVTFTMLLPVGIFFIASDLKKSIWIKSVLALFLLFNVIYSFGPRGSAAENETLGKQQSLECYRTHFIGLNNCYDVFPLCPNCPDDMRNLVSQAFIYKKTPVLQFSKLKKDYLNILPKGEPKDVFDLTTVAKLNGIINKDSLFSSINNDPNIIIDVSNLNGISWRSSATGNSKLYYLFDNKNDFSEEYSNPIESSSGIFIFNKYLFESEVPEKLVKIRIDPTDKIEDFKIEDFKVY